MCTEQPGLFGEFGKENNERPDYGAELEKDFYLPFLPGVQLNESLDNIQSLQELELKAQACTRCRLRAGCQQVVFADGPEDARIMFIG
jgi:AMMECR1 domain-containing protein